MSRRVLVAVVALFFAAVPLAQADPVTLTFTGLTDVQYVVKSGAPVNTDCYMWPNMNDASKCGLGQSLERVRGFYGGGSGEYGSTGPNYGVTFDDNARAIKTPQDGGTWPFYNADFPDPHTAMMLWQGPDPLRDPQPSAGYVSTWMSVALGITSMSFSYSNPDYSADVSVFDANGLLLASQTLARTGWDVASNGDWAPHWNQLTLDGLSGATQVRFYGHNGHLYLDEIALNLPDYHQITPWTPPIFGGDYIVSHFDVSQWTVPPTHPMSMYFEPVPEPASLLLLGSGLALLGRRVVRRRR